MRNKRKPFFYKEEKRRSSAIGTILIFILVAFIWVALVPTARQIFFPPLYPVYAYIRGVILRPRRPQAREFLNQPIYEVPELPDAEVIFADSLEALQSVLADEADAGESDGTSGLNGAEPTATPTAGINWVFVDRKNDAPPVETEFRLFRIRRGC